MEKRFYLIFSAVVICSFWLYMQYDSGVNFAYEPVETDLQNWAYASSSPGHPEKKFSEGLSGVRSQKEEPKAFYEMKSEEAEKVPEEWVERTHRAAPGDDWRSIEAASINQLVHQKNGHDRSDGNWTERGPSNIPGRITDIDVDYTNEYIYALSDHGIIFRSDLNGDNVTAQNDQYPLSLGVAGQIEHFDGTSGQLICSGFIRVLDTWGILYSNDGGENWTQSTGFPTNEITGIRRIKTEGDTAYLFVQEYDWTIPSDYYRIYKSLDNGLSFNLLYESAIPVGDGARHRKSDIWVSNDPAQSELFLLLEDSLFTVNKFSGARNFETMISGNIINQALLTGLTKVGITELTVYEENAGIGEFYSWSSAVPIPQFEGQIDDWWLSLPFGTNSFTCSAISADTLYFGAILTSKSTDRGQTWTTIDMDPTLSYALYHGDVLKTLSLVNPSTNEEDFYMGTDGGLYKWNNSVNSFDSLGIPGMNCTQIYKMVSEQAAPEKMYIGTQDNGYSHTDLGAIQPGTVDFTFQWGGDVTNVATGDGGETFWLWWLGDGCNYMLDATNMSSNWDPYLFDGSIPYWEPPVWVSNHFPDRCYTAGYLFGGSGSHIIKLQANPGDVAVPIELPTDFEALSGAKISALAISPIDSNYFYVATENGYFYSSSDGGDSWSSGTLIADFIYTREILPSKVNLGEVWVGGSGYSNAPVYFTSNHGGSFETFDVGMLPCRVNAFATNTDETALYAATSIGPYEFEIATGEWENIAGTEAPINEYMDVEFISSLNTVRFGTYARGIWDYSIYTVSLSEQPQDNGLIVYPNPASDYLTVQNPFNGLCTIKLINLEGKVVYSDSNQSPNISIGLTEISVGTYVLALISENELKTCKVLIER